MMKKILGGAVRKIILFALFLFIVNSAGAQILHQKKYSLFKKNTDYSKLTSKPGNTADDGITIPLVLSWPLNPMLVIEDKKPYFALTKEVSLLFPTFIYIGKKPLVGALGGEYSYVVRNGRNSHIRGFLDFLYILEAGDFAAFLLGAGGGYFTDTKKSGLFPQVSFSFIFPIVKGVGFQGYIRVRNAFMFKKEDSNVFDLSTGIGLTFFLGR
jgi:hypothetical protein